VRVSNVGQVPATDLAIIRSSVSYKIAISARLVAATSVLILAVGGIVLLVGQTWLGALLVLLAFVGLGCSLGLMATITVQLARQLARRTGLKIKFFDPWLL
jgi:hypothetical protein